MYKQVGSYDALRKAMNNFKASRCFEELIRWASYQKRLCEASEQRGNTMEIGKMTNEMLIGELLAYCAKDTKSGRTQCPEFKQLKTELLRRLNAEPPAMEGELQHGGADAQGIPEARQNTYDFYQCKECGREFTSSGGIPESLKNHQEDSGHKGVAGPYK